MIVDRTDSYLKVDDLNLHRSYSEAEEKIESTVSEVEAKYNEIKERCISLKAITNTLREQISREKELWIQELKETVELERQLREQHDCGSGDKLRNINDTDYTRKYDMYKEAYSTNARKELDDYFKKTDYQKTLIDVESKCNMELLKIQHSIKILKPLKEMAARWTQRGQLESGDQISTVTDNTETISEQQNTTDEESVKAEAESEDGGIVTDEPEPGDVEEKCNELS